MVATAARSGGAPEAGGGQPGAVGSVPLLFREERGQGRPPEEVPLHLAAVVLHAVHSSSLF